MLDNSLQTTDIKMAAQAVKVPVTPNLSANHTGFHQLLKSRGIVPVVGWV